MGRQGSHVQAGQRAANSVPRIARGRITFAFPGLRFDKTGYPAACVGVCHCLDRARLVLIGTLDVAGQRIACCGRARLDRPYRVQTVRRVGCIRHWPHGLVRSDGMGLARKSGSACRALRCHESLQRQSAALRARGH